MLRIVIWHIFWRMEPKWKTTFKVNIYQKAIKIWPIFHLQFDATKLGKKVENDQIFVAVLEYLNFNSIIAFTWAAFSGLIHSIHH